MNELQQFSESAAWLPAVAALAAAWAGGATRFLSTNEWARNAIWCRAPSGYRWIVPYANAALVGVGSSLIAGRDWKAALLETATAMVGGGLGSIGGHETMKNSKLPYGNKDVAACDVQPGPSEFVIEPQPGDKMVVEATFFPHQFADAATALRAPSDPPAARVKRLPIPPPKPGGDNAA